MVFPFSSISWIIQNRFIEICDLSILANFVQINSWTRKLCDKRIQRIDIINLKFIDADNFKHHDDTSELLEVKDLLIINSGLKLVLVDVSYIIPTHSRLIINAREMDIKVLKHLILGQNLKELSLKTKLIFKSDKEIKEVVNMGREHLPDAF